MTEARQRHLVLLLARDLASNIASAVLLVDPQGRLVYFNERAEELVGASYAHAGSRLPAEWADSGHPEDLDGRPLPIPELPMMVAMRERRPAHKTMRITAMDGVRRTLAVTAIPLLATDEELVGCAAVFWEEGAA